VEEVRAKMIMISFRLRTGRVLLSLLAIALIVTLSVMGIKAVRSDDAISTGSEQVEEAAKPKKTKVKSEQDRQEFIRSFGWEVEEEPVEVLEVIIPKEFDSVYEAYNSMQKRQGYDLSQHAGKRCKRYSYVVTNYPGQPEDVRINLLIRGNRVIGGDVCSMLEGGFMHGFSMDQASVPQAK
jgi:hypothetical protein